MRILLDHNVPAPLRNWLIGHEVETADGRRLTLVVISTNDWTRIRKSKSVVVSAISDIASGSFMEIEIPFQ